MDHSEGIAATVAEAKSRRAGAVPASGATTRALVVWQDDKNSVVVLATDEAERRDVRIRLDASPATTHEFGSRRLDHNLDEESAQTVRATPRSAR